MFDPDDVRRQNPRFQGENFQQNLDLVDRVGEIAEDKGVTPSQLALAWVLHQSDDIVPIPGTKRRRYLENGLDTAPKPTRPNGGVGVSMTSGGVARTSPWPATTPAPPAPATLSHATPAPQRSTERRAYWAEPRCNSDDGGAGGGERQEG